MWLLLANSSLHVSARVGRQRKWIAVPFYSVSIPLASCLPLPLHSWKFGRKRRHNHTGRLPGLESNNTGRRVNLKNPPTTLQKSPVSPSPSSRHQPVLYNPFEDSRVKEIKGYREDRFVSVRGESIYIYRESRGDIKRGATDIMQQHLMQMQPMMAGYASQSQVTTDIIQQYLDENKQLILAILDNQSSGKADECAENQAKLQRNLMYLAAIADSQPQMNTMAQYPSNPVMQSGARYLPHQQAQQMASPSLLAARSSMLYPQSPMSALQQQHQLAFHGQLSMSSPGTTAGFNVFHGDASMGGNGNLASGIFPDFGRSGALKPEMAGGEGRSGSSGGHSGDGTEPLYLKASEAEGN